MCKTFIFESFLSQSMQYNNVKIVNWVLGCTLESEIDSNALTFEWQLNISKITNVVKFYFSHHGDRGSRPTHDGDDLQGIVRQWWPCILCHNWSLPRVYNSQNEYQVILFYMYLHSQFYCFLSFNKQPH